MAKSPSIQIVDDHVPWNLPDKLPLAPQEHEVRLEASAIEMTKQRHENALRTAAAQGADEQNHLFARTAAVRAPRAFAAGRPADTRNQRATGAHLEICPAETFSSLPTTDI